MFTIRVEHDRGSRTMYGAQQYKVRLNGKTSALLILQDGEVVTEVPVQNGETAYVMNNAGQTVDTIRTERSIGVTTHGS